MIRRIPSEQTRRWTGPYPGMYRGDLRRTFGVDLDRNEGAVSLSAKLARIEDSTELTDLSGDSNRVIAFTRTDADCTDRYWALSGSALYKTDSFAAPNPSQDWDTDALANTPTTAIQDFTVHGNDSRNDSGRNKLFVSLDSDVSVLNDTGNSAWTASWWVTKQSQPALDTNFPHPIEFFAGRKITLIGDGNLVHTVSRTSDTQNDTVTNSRLVLPKNLVATSIFCTAERAWIGCFNRRQDRGAVVEWDGFSQTANRIHEINGIAAISGVNYGGVPVVLENTGRFLEYTGNGFAPMVRDGAEVSLVSPEDLGMSLTNGTTISTIGPAAVHWRGMVVGEDGLVYVNLAGSFNGGYGLSHERMAGIWCLNPSTGRLYNKYALAGNTSDTTDMGHQAVGALSGVAAGSFPGGLYWVPNDALLFGRNLLAGGIVFSTATVAEGGIWLLEDYGNGVGPNQGYFVTQYVPADEVSEFFDTLWVTLRQRLLGTGNQVLVKARGVQHILANDNEPIDKTITWTAATTFTVTLSAGGTLIQVGDEIEVLYGENAGIIAHITAISGAQGGVQTMTIDESVGQVSGTSVARFDRWKKLGTLDDPTRTAKKLNVGIDSSFVQFKVVLRSTQGSFYARQLGVSSLLVTSKPSTNP